MVQVHTSINLDGRKVGESVSNHVTDAFRRNTSRSTFDTSMGLGPVGLAYAE